MQIAQKTEFVVAQIEGRITWIRFKSAATSLPLCNSFMLLWRKIGQKEHKCKSGLLGFHVWARSAYKKKSTSRKCIAPGTGIKFSRAGKESLCSLDQPSSVRKPDPKLFTNTNTYTLSLTKHQVIETPAWQWNCINLKENTIYFI